MLVALKVLFLFSFHLISVASWLHFEVIKTRRVDDRSKLVVANHHYPSPDFYPLIRNCFKKSHGKNKTQLEPKICKAHSDLIKYVNSVFSPAQKKVEMMRRVTLEMCRNFNEENKNLTTSPTMKLNIEIPPNKIGHVLNIINDNVNLTRQKRNVGTTPPVNPHDILRVERIVDKIYDDIYDRGENVTYRQIVPVSVVNQNSNADNKSNVTSGRRFNFAPQKLSFREPEHQNRPAPMKHNETFDIDTGKEPRFKHGIVPYYIDSKTYDGPIKQKIKAAFNYIEKMTCIRLERMRSRPVDLKSMNDDLWLYISNPAGIRQCVHSNELSEVQGVQHIVFGYDCMSLGDILHEMMHVLGFSHEHLRPDRDEYISIQWDNIKPGYKKYFEAISHPLLGNLPYDYGSVLHYPSRAFSKNGQPTILTAPGILIGQRQRLSEIDMEKIHIMYSAECIKRKKAYLQNTCPSVVNLGGLPQAAKEVTKEDIDKYYEAKIWPYAVVNFKFKERNEFSKEEIYNIHAVARHIETETNCIEFRFLGLGNEVDSQKYDQDFHEVITGEIFEGKPSSTEETYHLGNGFGQTQDDIKNEHGKVKKGHGEIKTLQGEVKKENGTINKLDGETEQNTNKGLKSVLKLNKKLHKGNNKGKTQLKQIEYRDTKENTESRNDNYDYSSYYDNFSGKVTEKIINLIDTYEDTDGRRNAQEMKFNVGPVKPSSKKKTKGKKATLTKKNVKKKSPLKKPGDNKKQTKKSLAPKKLTKKGLRKGKNAKSSKPISVHRRHATNIIVLSKSSDPGCRCSSSGKPEGILNLQINEDCFNSINDLLHVFMHVLGMEHQHNMHDRDSFVKIMWNDLVPEVKKELENKLPPAASVGFPYDYQSVMHYPWLQIINGQHNVMYPIWTDGWDMGHWQGLSATDVQKLKVIYGAQCKKRKHEVRQNQLQKADSSGGRP